MSDTQMEHTSAEPKKKKHLMACPFWETDNNLCHTLIICSLCETHGKPDCHLPCHVFLNLYVDIKKLEISSIK